MKPNPKLVITLDGPSGSGKSSASIRLAYHFRLPCLDTGAMYRTVAYRALQDQIDLKDEVKLVKLAKKLSFNFGFEGKEPFAEVSEAGELRRIGNEIRTPEVSLAASHIAQLKKLRAILVSEQQEIGKKQGAVVEGRDAGTVIFPKARIKFFLTASTEERAKRRFAELKEKLGKKAQAYKDVLKEMKIRDKQDSQRAASPLKPAEDAILIDTTGLDFDQVVRHLIEKVEELLLRTV